MLRVALYSLLLAGVTGSHLEEGLDSSSLLALVAVAEVELGSAQAKD